MKAARWIAAGAALVSVAAAAVYAQSRQTEQPDFAVLRLLYQPGPRVLELKAIKLYVNSYRERTISHEEVVNRILEPFQLMRTIVTATEWSNFFHLRDHEDAQPEIRALAIAMREAMEASTPKRLSTGEWHLPYVLENETRLIREELLRMLSTARCARVSYLTHDGQEPNVKKDIELHDRLVVAKPIHASRPPRRSSTRP